MTAAAVAAFFLPPTQMLAISTGEEREIKKRCNDSTVAVSASPPNSFDFDFPFSPF